MKFNKYSKGEYEYAKYNKNRVLIYTVIMFSLSIALYLIGYFTTKTNKNYLTIFAILGLLPASKSLVSLIMNFRVKTSNLEFKNEIESRIGDLYGMYHMYFTSYDTNFYFDHLIITSNSLICYSSDSKIDEKKFKEHFEKHMKIEGINDVMIKVFNNSNNYFRRLEELNESEANLSANQSIVNLIYSITL